jgi:hypothetical protein
MFKKYLVATIIGTSLYALPIPVLSKKAFQNGSGTQIGLEIKNVDFDKTNINGTIYGLKIGFEHMFGKSNFGINWGFFADYGKIDDSTIAEGGMFLAPKYVFNFSEKTNLDIYAGIKGKYVGIESSEGYGFVPYGGIELSYNKWSIAVEYSTGTISFETADIDENAVSTSINYRF